MHDARSRNKGSNRQGTYRKIVRRRPWGKLIFLWLTGFLFLGTILGMLFLGALYYREGAFVNEFVALKDLGAHKPTRIVSADGVILAEMATSKQEPVKLSAVPKDIINATVAAEDRNFYSHSGIDFRGIARALWVNVRGGRMEQGASTITQQLARNAFLSQDRTMERKIREAMIAIHLEQRLTKDEILELYLNRVYYGSGSYGVKAASKTYFGKELSQLSLSECSLLAGLPQKPTVLALKPDKPNDAAYQRREYVLESMKIMGFIKANEGKSVDDVIKKANADRPKIIEHKRTAIPYKAPYFVTYVIQDIEKTFGPSVLEEGGWTIQTTLRYDFQVKAQKAMQSMLESKDYANEGALVLIDLDGKILAMVGGSDFERSQYNVITQGLRQPGSAFKPIVYATAFDQGVLTPYSTLPDNPLKRGSWTPQNANGKFSGSVSVDSAVVHSINIPAIHALERTGIGKVVDYAKNRFGLTSNIEAVPSLALGTSDVRPIELASAYTVFAKHGSRAVPYGIVRMIGPTGSVNQEFIPKIIGGCISPIASDYMDGLLRSVVTRGTAASAPGIHRVNNAHGKTGTTNNHLDAWFCGYTDKYVCVVWVANVRYNRDKNPPYVYKPMPGVFGGNSAARVWASLLYGVQQIDANTEKKADKSQDESKINALICADSGMLATGACPHVVRKSFTPSMAPVERCSQHPSMDDPIGTTDETGDIPVDSRPPASRNNPAEPKPNTPNQPEIIEVAPDDPQANDMVEIDICADTGKRANRYCPETNKRKMKRKDIPGTCTKHREGVH